MALWRSTTHEHGLGLRSSFVYGLYIICLSFTMVSEIHGNSTTSTTTTRATYGIHETTTVPTGHIRLNGSKPNEGVVEVLADGEWGAICDDNFDHEEANVACRQLGYSNGADDYFSHAAFKFDISPYKVIFYDNLKCYGYENFLQQCTYINAIITRDNNCYDGYSVAGVRCDTGISRGSTSLALTVGWIIFLVVIVLVVLVSVLVIVGLGIRRYRQHHAVG